MGLAWMASLARQAVALGLSRPVTRPAAPAVLVPEWDRAARAVWRQNQRLNAALTGLPQAVLLVDPEARRACGNPRFAALCGLPAGAVESGGQRAGGCGGAAAPRAAASRRQQQ